MYKRLYILLFNRVTDAIEKLKKNRSNEAMQMLIKAQQDCEELYISHADSD